MFSRTRRGYSLLVLMLGTALAAPPALRAATPKDILENVPADAWGFLLIGSLDGIDTKAAKLGETLGLPIPPQVSNMALASLGIGEEIDRKSPICAVMMDAQKFASADKAAVLIIPASNPKGLLEKLQGSEGTDGVTKCTVMGEPAFASVKGKMVILGPDQDCVTKVAKSSKMLGDKLAKARMAVIEKSDIYLSVSLGAVATTYKDMWMPMMQMMTAPTDPEGKSVKQISKAVTEVSALDIAINLDDGGFGFKILIDAVENSDLQKLLGDEKSTSNPLLAGLPKETYLLTMGSMASHSEHAAKFSSQTPISDLMRMTQMEGLDAKSVEALDKEIVSIQKMIKHYAVSVAALPDGSDGIFGVTLVAETDSAKDFIEGVRKAYQTAWKVTSDEDVATVKEAITHKADAETIADNKVDTITFDMQKLSELEEGADDDLKHVHAVLGKECVLRFGPGGDKHVVFTWGGGKDRFESVCTALKAKGEMLSSDKGITELSEQLPSPRVSEGFIAVDNILQTIKKAMKAVGEEEEFPFEVPTIDAPLAGSTTVQDNVMRLDFVVPMKLIKAGKEAYDKYAATAAEEDFDEEGDDTGDEGATADEDAGGEESDDTTEDDGGDSEGDDGTDDE